jgi:hypothetical protein
MIFSSEFFDYVTKLYNGSSRPLNIKHLTKGCLMEYATKTILDEIVVERAEAYVEALGIGYGPDFHIGIPPFIVPLECKNERDHRESEGGVRADIINRFSDYSRQSPKILVTSPVHYSRTARRLLDDNNVQILETSRDLNTLTELEEILPDLRDKFARALYKFRHYKRYKPRNEPPKNRTGDRYILHREPLGEGSFPSGSTSFWFYFLLVLLPSCGTQRVLVCWLCTILSSTISAISSTISAISSTLSIPSSGDLRNLQR